MTLEEALAEVARLTPDDDPFTAKDFFGTGITLEGEEAVATILNAVASGQLIPLSDHKLAVAEAYRKSGDVADGYHQRALEWAKTLGALAKYVHETDSSKTRDDILALADTDDLAALEASELAAAGCSDELIMAVTGHQTSAMVVKYAGSAMQRARATEAQGRRK